MSTLVDPGKDLDPAAAAEARLVAWARPADKTGQDSLRAARVTDARARMPGSKTDGRVHSLP